MSKTNKSFAEKMSELEEIVAWFESDSVDLDKSMEKFKRGTELVKELKSEISDVENKVKKLNQTD